MARPKQLVEPVMITMLIEKHVLDELDKKAEQMGMTRSDLIRNAILQVINKK